MHDATLEEGHDLVLDIISLNSWGKEQDLDVLADDFQAPEKRDAFKPFIESRKLACKALLESSSDDLAFWSAEMLAIRERIIEANLWRVQSDMVPNRLMQGENKITKIFQYFSSFDISNLTIDHEIINKEDGNTGQTLLLPGNLLALSTNFRRPIRISSLRCLGGISFREASFCADSSLKIIDVRHLVDFSRCRFERTASISGTFKGNIWLESSTFMDRSAIGLHCEGNIAGFGQANFKEWTGINCVFNCLADFSGVVCEGSFHLQNTYFGFVPDFRQTSFRETPDFGSSLVFSGSVPKKEHQKDDYLRSLPSRYRALRRLARSANDYPRELDFFAEELKARRGIEDFILPNPRNLLFRRAVIPALDDGFMQLAKIPFWKQGKGKTSIPVFQGSSRYIFGLIYQMTSDFGRSAGRALFGLLAVWLLFSFIYAHMAFSRSGVLDHLLRLDQTSYFILGEITGDQRLPGGSVSCDVPNSAVQVSLRQSLLLPNSLGLFENPSAEECLFGSASGSKAPRSRYWISDQLLLLTQSLLALILYSGLILTIRNYFRMR